MKKIFNWTFGSVFRTFGRIIAYLLIGLLFALIMSKTDVKITDLLGVQKINAAVAEDWATVYAGKNFNNVTQAWVADCTSNGCSSVSTEVNSIGSSMGNTGAFIGNQNSLTIGNNGIMIAYSTNTRLAANYLYSISTYVCSNKNLYDVTKHPYIGSSSSEVFNKNIARYYAISSAGLSGNVSTSHTFNYCYSINTLIVPNEVSSVMGINLHTSPSMSGAYVYILGYNIDSLGLYSNEVRDIVTSAIGSSTSGLATTSQLNRATEQIKQEQQNTTNAVDNLNDSITNNDSSGASSEFSDFFENFTTNTHGLTSIITAPLNSISSLLSSSCSSLVLPLPFVNSNLTLPCMRNIYESYFGSFMALYDVITFGILSYWVIVRIFALVKDFKNPDHDEIEVVDL